MSEIVDRAAKRLYEYSGYTDWRSLGEAFKESYRRQVRLVVREIRDPIDDMIHAAEEADQAASDANLNAGGSGRGLYADDIYRTMIDVILEENQ